MATWILANRWKRGTEYRGQSAWHFQIGSSRCKEHRWPLVVGIGWDFTIDRRKYSDCPNRSIIDYNRWDWVRLTRNQQNTRATNLSAEPTDYLRHIQVFLCFGPFLQLIKTKIFPHFWPGVSRITTRADKCWAVKRALRSSFNVWCGVGLARALFPRFRCAWRPAKFSFLQTGNPIFFL